MATFPPSFPPSIYVLRMKFYVLFCTRLPPSYCSWVLLFNCLSLISYSLLIKKLMVKNKIPWYFLLKITDDFAHIQYCSGRCAQSVIKKNRCAQHSKSFFHLFFGLVGLFRTNKNKLITEMVLTAVYVKEVIRDPTPRHRRLQLCKFNVPFCINRLY